MLKDNDSIYSFQMGGRWPSIIDGFRHFISGMFLVLMMMGLTACHDKKVTPDNVLDTVITQDNVENLMKITRQRYPDLAESKQNIVNSIAAISQGRKAYYDYLMFRGEQDQAHYIVRDKLYQRRREHLFETLDEHDITLGQLFNELDKKASFIASFHEKNHPFYQAIDRENKAIQHKIDQLDVYLKPQLAKLNKKVSVTLHTIEWEDNAFYIYLNLKNHFGVPIKELTFTYTLVDEHGHPFFTRHHHMTNLYFDDEYTNFTDVIRLFDKYQGPQAYQALRHNHLRSASLTYRITAIKTGDKSWPEYGQWQSVAHYTNQHYQSPEPLRGEGPYTSKGEQEHLKLLNQQYQRDLAKLTPALHQYQQCQNGFYDSVRQFISQFQ